nr:MAG TPA_asm: hypothetical protein [Bacteriophage sp.]
MLITRCHFRLNDTHCIIKSLISSFNVVFIKTTFYLPVR